MRVSVTLFSRTLQIVDVGIFCLRWTLAVAVPTTKAAAQASTREVGVVMVLKIYDSS